MVEAMVVPARSQNSGGEMVKLSKLSSSVGEGSRLISVEIKKEEEVD